MIKTGKASKELIRLNGSRGDPRCVICCREDKLVKHARKEAAKWLRESPKQRGSK